MDRFLALSVFAKVVEQGSFARAAERLELSTSAVSRHVAELEAHLDARLINRTTRRLSLTETGSAFYERCVQLLADLEEAEEAVTSAAVVPRGTLKLTCSITFGIRHLAAEASCKRTGRSFSIAHAPSGRGVYPRAALCADPGATTSPLRTGEETIASRH